MVVLLAMVQNKSTQAAGKQQSDIIVIEKKKKLSIPKDLNLIACWNIIGPQLAHEFDEGYTHIPYCLEANAYKLGHIFVPIEEQVKCFCVTEVVKIIGPISNFVIKGPVNPKVLEQDFNTVRTQPDAPNFQMILTGKKSHLIFTGYDCLFLDRPLRMIIQTNLKIDRTSHEDLTEAKWFGVITGVLATKNFELKVLRESDTRTTFIGDDMHTVLFRYEICEMDSDGFVTKTSKKKMDVRWAPVMGQPRESLPLPQLAAILKR